MVSVHMVNAFAKAPNGGNPAGVCLEAEGLADNDMQKIAMQIGASETAFLMRSSEEKFSVRYFTPLREVPLCGHATIASFYLMQQKGIIKPGNFSLSTNVGELKIEVEEGKVYMHQKKLKVLGMPGMSEVSQGLGISDYAIRRNIPIQVVSTGSPVMIVPMDSLESLLNMKPDRKKVIELSKAWDDAIIYAFTSQTMLPRSTAHARMFDPVDGIDEEAATGVAAGALFSYMAANNILSSPYSGFIEQGYVMGRPSEIEGRVAVKGGLVEGVIIGGTAVLVEKREIVLPKE